MAAESFGDFRFRLSIKGNYRLQVSFGAATPHWAFCDLDLPRFDHRF